jgi:hypothetical protein
MIKLPLILLLLSCAFYGWRQRSLSPIIGSLTPLTCALGVALVLKPDWSSEAARLLGVGRGADLILYVWTAISILVLANIHFRLRAHQRTITALTRELALLGVRRPVDASPRDG